MVIQSKYSDKTGMFSVNIHCFKHSGYGLSQWETTLRCNVMSPYSEHYSDVIMSAMASQITGVPIACLTVYKGADQRKHQNSISLAFVRGIPGDRRFPQRAINTVNVPIWWRHHDDPCLSCLHGPVFLHKVEFRWIYYHRLITILWKLAQQHGRTLWPLT